LIIAPRHQAEQTIDQRDRRFGIDPLAGKIDMNLYRLPLKMMVRVYDLRRYEEASGSATTLRLFKVSTLVD